MVPSETTKENVAYDFTDEEVILHCNFFWKTCTLVQVWFKFYFCPRSFVTDKSHLFNKCYNAFKLLALFGTVRNLHIGS